MPNGKGYEVEHHNLGEENHVVPKISQPKWSGAFSEFTYIKSTFNIGELRKRPGPFWLAYFWYNMVLFTQVVMFYFISFAIGHPISFSLAFIVFTLVKFISMVAFVPGALGV